MPVGNQPNHGTLDHRQLRTGDDVLPDGEKPRPHYLGLIESLNAQVGEHEHITTNTTLEAVS